MTFLLPLLLACADPAADVTAADVAPVTASAAAAPAAPAAPAYAGQALTPTGTVGFTGAKVTKSHDGVFGDWSGQLYVDGDAVTGLTLDVAVGSLQTDSAKLDGHLKSEDFFEVARWPTATFRSKAVAAGAPEGSQLAGATHTVTGDLTIRDTTREVSFPAAITVEGGEVRAATEFFINRADFGIVYPGKPDDLIKDEVVLRATRSAPRG